MRRYRHRSQTDVAQWELALSILPDSLWLTPEEMLRRGFSYSNIVIVNEVHDGKQRCVHHRTLGYRLLNVAHTLGVRDIAIEALYPRSLVTEANRTRKLPNVEHGYLSQPDMRHLVQRCLDKGWRVWDYEMQSKDAARAGAISEKEFANFRDEVQARNLLRVWSQLSPEAQLMIWCGNSHGGKIRTSTGWVPMGAHLSRAGVEPFVIDQSISIVRPEYVAAVREQLAGFGGAAARFREDSGPLASRRDVDAFVFSVDNVMS